jgi:hypothetical protein
MCDYRYYSGGYVCYFENVDLTKKTSNETFTFSASQEQKKNTTRIRFERIGRVAHVPQNLVEELPKLIGLEIWRSEIPIVKNDLFGPQFSQIEKLDLGANKIKIIEDQAFQHLSNLKEIYLYMNEIRSLSSGVFKNNRKLKEIILWDNKIKMIAPDTFQSLNQLIHVHLDGNDGCINKLIGCRDCDSKINRTDLNRELQDCYDIHKKSSNLLNDGENSF